MIKKSLIQANNSNHFGREEKINFLNDDLMILIRSLTVYAELIKMHNVDFSDKSNLFRCFPEMSCTDKILIKP